MMRRKRGERHRTQGTAQQVTIWRSTSPSAESKRTDTASWQACGMVHGAVAEKLI